MKKVFCLFLSMFILLNVVNTDILRINSSAENDMLEYSTVDVITNNIAENDISNEVGEGSQTGVDIAIPTENKTKLIKKNDKIYMSLEDICKFTRTNIEKTDNKYMLKQGRQEITVLIEANGNAKIKSLYGEFNTHTIIDDKKIYCEPEPLMSILFADCTYYDNTLLINLPQYTVYEATNFDYTKYQSDIMNFGIDDDDNMATGLVKFGLTAQRIYVSFAADIIVDCNYGFFATDNTTRQYYYEAFNEVLGYDIYSNETINEEETKKYENQKELGSFLEKTQNGDVSDTPFTDFYISSYIRSYAKTGLKDSSSLSMFNDTIRDLSTNGRVNEKINSFLNQSGTDVITNVLFNSILEYIKRSSYDRKVLQMFKTLYSDETVNKYNISLSENGKFFFQCAKDYYNSCSSFDNIVKEVTLNESINKFSEIMLKGAFYLSTGGKSQEVFETYETILSAEKLRESNSSFKPIEKINNSAKYVWLAKMQNSTIITLDEINKKANESLNSDDMENFVSNLDFYNRVSAVMIKTLADSYQLPTATEREKDLMAHSDEYIKDLAINTYKLECCEYNLPTKEELNNKNYDVFKKFFSNQEGETTETTTETTSTTTETTITTTETTPTTTIPNNNEDIDKQNFIQISLEVNRSATITEDGSLYIWGHNNYGQLGNGTTEDSLVPIKIMDNVKSVSLGSYHSAAITEDGSLYTWGHNNYGQLGSGTTNDNLVPIKIMDNVKSVSLGSCHSAAITEDGSLYMWGHNAIGQLGNGTRNNSLVPIKIMDNIKSVSLGWDYSAAITESNNLYMWGFNLHGELGNGLTNAKLSPTKIMNNVKSVSLGSCHSAAITEDNSLYVWGDNFSGQLGNGTKNNSLVPIKIMDNVKSVSLGYGHSAAITEDGSLYMWGNNEEGELGNGTTEDSLIPIKIINNIKYINLGNLHSVVITEDGSLYIWGSNEYGQLGNGTTENSLIPIKIDIKN